MLPPMADAAEYQRLKTAAPQLHRHLLDRNELGDQVAHALAHQALYGREIATGWPVADPTFRFDLAHVPHSITVEPITPELRRGTELPDNATLVIVERHAGRLAKVCNATDAHAAEHVSWGYDVTVEALARGIAGTYGATYVPDLYEGPGRSSELMLGGEL